MRGTLLGPSYKGILLFGGLFWGSPIFVIPRLCCKGFRVVRASGGVILMYNIVLRGWPGGRTLAKATE